MSEEVRRQVNALRNWAGLLQSFYHWIPVFSRPLEPREEHTLVLARALRTPDQASVLQEKLLDASTPDEQNKILKDFLTTSNEPTEKPASKAEPKQKFEFYVGQTKVTARHGECRLMSDIDFATMPKKQLEEAVRAFEEVLSNGPRIR